MQTSPCLGCEHEKRSKRSWQPCIDCQLSGKPYKYADQYGLAGFSSDYKPDLFGGRKMDFKSIDKPVRPDPPLGNLCKKCGKVMDSPDDFVRNVKSLTGYLETCRQCFSSSHKKSVEEKTSRPYKYKRREKPESQDHEPAVKTGDIPLIDRVLQKYPNIIDIIKKQADEQDRTPDAQLVWIVRNALESCDGCIKQVHKFLIERDGDSHGRDSNTGSPGAPAPR